VVLYTVEELTALAKVLEKYPEIIVVADEIYEHIFSGTFAALHLSQEC
jgi:aspartate aminotransferase